MLRINGYGIETGSAWLRSLYGERFRGGLQEVTGWSAVGKKQYRRTWIWGKTNCTCNAEGAVEGTCRSSPFHAVSRHEKGLDNSFPFPCRTCTTSVAVFASESFFPSVTRASEAAPGKHRTEIFCRETEGNGADPRRRNFDEEGEKSLSRKCLPLTASHNLLLHLFPAYGTDFHVAADLLVGYPGIYLGGFQTV